MTQTFFALPLLRTAALAGGLNPKYTFSTYLSYSEYVTSKTSGGNVSLGPTTIASLC